MPSVVTPYAIIIPTRDANKLAACVRRIQLMQSLFPVRYEIIVVDDDEGGKVEEFFGMRPSGMDVRITGIKPFNFSVNVNLGINLALEMGLDCLILNDDALLETSRGFNLLSIAANREREYGVVSPAVRGFVGNPEQRRSLDVRYAIRPTQHHSLAFVCVYIRNDVIHNIGPLDERFTCYSHQDDDYCQRVRDAGYKLGVYDACVVEHGETLRSSFRHNADGSLKHQDLEVGRGIFREKHGFYPGEKVG